jgi:hypothetical protein
VFKFELTGDEKPMANLSLLAWDPGFSLARVGARRLADVTTDQSGRFRVMAYSDVIFLETAPGSAVKFHCPSLPHYGGENDVRVFDLSWSGAPWPGGFFGIAGKVVERVGDVVQPISGATVTLDDESRDLPTTSNANGFFSICSIFTTDMSRTVTARKSGYRPLFRTIIWGFDEANLTLMLERN